MSLDVYLSIKDANVDNQGSGIFIRENGQKREISREEWDRKFPKQEPIRWLGEEGSDDAFSANITHNLSQMAAEAGIYVHLWRPDEIGITKAHQLIEPLQAGLSLMKSDPARFQRHNPKNGWGTYEGFVQWIDRYLRACEELPDADVRVSR